MSSQRFPPEFTVEAVKLVPERGVTVAQAARDPGLHENIPRKWVRDRMADPVDAFPGHRQMKPEQAEIAALRKEVAKLRMERDIPKKPLSQNIGFSAPGRNG